jgi:hypothetical protein
MSMPIWLTAFVDLPGVHHERVSRFWSEVTGWPLSAPRGDEAEFTTLLPPVGDPHLKLQRVGGVVTGTHLDVHVDDPEAALARAEELGASLVLRHPEGYVVVRSPGGFTFCLVREHLTHPAPPTTWPDGHASIVDQLCLDIPSRLFPDETRFWAALTGWDLHQSAVRDEFAYLSRPRGVSIRVLMQRLDDRDGVVRAHLDLATTDRPAEVRRHEALGATQAVDQPGLGWTVMRDPAGSSYCITHRDPTS